VIYGVLGGKDGCRSGRPIEVLYVESGKVSRGGSPRSPRRFLRRLGSVARRRDRARDCPSRPSLMREFEDRMGSAVAAAERMLRSCDPWLRARAVFNE
jgi:hypothetical protein